mmetsp:Transcript_28769/g.84023  ORF Transcript_28769/g.84023 Transcript_28769/m.84023 type:complete len:235 (-) Transcript_28769:185-889(-)
MPRCSDRHSLPPWHSGLWLDSCRHCAPHSRVPSVHGEIRHAQPHMHPEDPPQMHPLLHVVHRAVHQVHQRQCLHPDMHLGHQLLRVGVQRLLAHLPQSGSGGGGDWCYALPRHHWQGHGRRAHIRVVLLRHGHLLCRHCEQPCSSHRRGGSPCYVRRLHVLRGLWHGHHNTTPVLHRRRRDVQGPPRGRLRGECSAGLSPGPRQGQGQESCEEAESIAGHPPRRPEKGDPETFQ